MTKTPAPPAVESPEPADPPFTATAVRVIVVEALVLAALLAFQLRFGS